MDGYRSSFHPVIALPAGYEVYDFTAGYDPDRLLRSPYGIGLYNERRVAMYTTELFTVGQRDVHAGVDLGAPAGTPVYAFARGTVWRSGENPAPGDYGPTVITRHELGAVTLYALHGHLDRQSLARNPEGRAFEAGDLLGHVGDRHENGGWNPHLHFQLAWDPPPVADLPGVVHVRDREAALARFPDPRMVLGPLY